MGRRERSREFFRTLPGGAAIRVRFDRDQGQIGDFTAQFEILVADVWMPAVRHDSVHRRPHRDTLDRSGRVVAKPWLPEGMDANAALTVAERDLIANFERYRDEFMGRKP